MRIGIDIDDVMGDFVPEFIKWTGKDVNIENITSYDMSKAYGITSNTMWKWITQFYKTHQFANLPTLPSSVDSLSSLPQHTFIAITARPINTLSITQAWLAMNFSYVNLPFVFVGVKDKGLLAQQEQLELLIDDGLHNIASMNKRNLPAILVDKPWNRDVLENPMYMRMYDWNEIYNYLKDKK